MNSLSLSILTYLFSAMVLIISERVLKEVIDCLDIVFKDCFFFLWWALPHSASLAASEFSPSDFRVVAFYK